MKQKSFIVSVVALFLICGLFVFTILFFINPFTPQKQYNPTPDGERENLSDVISVSELQEIFTETKTDIPTSDEILSFTKYYNNDKKIYWDEIIVDENNITETEAVLRTHQSTHYAGVAWVTYTVKQQMNLENLFPKKELEIGEIFLPYGEIITKQDISDKLKIIAPELDQTHLTLINLNDLDNTVILVGDNLKYVNQILLKFSINREPIKLKNKIVNTELGILRTHWQNKPSKIQIIQAIQSKAENSRINFNNIEIRKIEKNNAELVGNGIYEGTVIVNYQIDMRIELTEHLKNTDIGNVKISQNDADKNGFLIALLRNINTVNEEVNPLAITTAEKNLNLKSEIATIIPISDKMDEQNYLGKVIITFRFYIP